MRRLILFLLYLTIGGGSLLLASQGFYGSGFRLWTAASGFRELRVVPFESEDVEIEIGPEGSEGTLRATTGYRVRGVDLPLYRKDAEGRDTSDLDSLLTFDSVEVTAEGELLLENPRLVLFRQPEWIGEGAASAEETVETVLSSRKGRVERGMESGRFWGEVEISSSDGRTVSVIETESIWCFFPREAERIETLGRQARTDDAVRFRTGADLESDPDMVVTGVGLNANLDLRKLGSERPDSRRRTISV